jgi:GNAT superfamily N-acetyltransferase
VPPLREDVRKSFDPAANPVFEHAEVEPFLALRDGRAVGRVAAIHNRAHNDFHGDRVGFFGFFECEDDPEAAAALLAAAADWVGARGLDTLRGPMSFSTNDECGVLVSGFERPPAIMMPHNPPYYARLLEAAGCTTAKNLLAYHFAMRASPYLERAAEAVRRRCRATCRGLRLDRFDTELALIGDVYNAAWDRNWGFVPMTAREFEHMAHQLRPVVDPEIVRFAEVDGELAGFAIAIPDVNRALARLDGRMGPWGTLKFLWLMRRVDTARVLALGVREGFRATGVDVLLYRDLFTAGERRGYRSGELSWVLEDNMAIRRPIERLGGVADKVYRLYDRPVQAGAGGAPGNQGAAPADR